MLDIGRQTYHSPHYTGHPLIDIGLATIAAFVNKASPEQLTQDDLGAIADYMERNYVIDPLKSFLTVVFPNSGFTQPAYNTQPEKRQIYSDRVLRAYAADTLEERCIFLDLPIPNVPYDVKGELEPGRAYRQHIPMLTGEGVINFGAEGEPGFPVSGLTLLAIQAFPLGCKKCMGRLLGVHSDSPEIIRHFATAFLRENQRLVNLAQLSGDSKLPEPAQSPLTLLMETFVEVEWFRKDAREEGRPFSVTAYHLSNSGQGPQLDIYHLPFQITTFVRRMWRAEFRQKWQAIVNRAWQKPKGKKGEQDFQPRYNTLYEDLFRLPENAKQFIRAYFLRIPSRYGLDKQDPRLDYSPRTEAQFVSWDVTAQFLERVLKMEQGRINEIREMGDRLADYVYAQNDRRFFRNFFTARRYDNLRNALIKANADNLRRGAAPIVEFDPFVSVFEEGDELARTDWRLARDLVLIRMIEQLYAKGWLSQNMDQVPDSPEEQEEE
jgi:CRISPR-associated protein Cst1